MGLHVPLWLSHPPLILSGFGLGEAFPRKDSLSPYGEPLTFRGAPSPQPVGPELSTGQTAGQMDGQSPLRPSERGWQVGCCLSALGGIVSFVCSAPGPPPSSSPNVFSLMAEPAAGEVPPVCCRLARWRKSGLPNCLLLPKLRLWIRRHRGLREKSQPE